VADLLECLIQISALRETVAGVRGLATVSTTPAARDEVRRGVMALLEAEARWQTCLRAILPASLTATLVVPPPAATDLADLCDAFERARLSTHAVLNACSGVDLAAAGTIEGRPRATAADVVAMMLAGDIEAVGELRRTVETHPR